MAEHNNEFASIPINNGTALSQSAVQRTNSPKPKVRRNRKEDFKMMRLLGSGAFATVMLTKKKDDEKLYAMKIVEKALLSRVSNSFIQIGKQGTVCYKRTHCIKFSVTPRNS